MPRRPPGGGQENATRTRKGRPINGANRGNRENVEEALVNGEVGGADGVGRHGEGRTSRAEPIDEDREGVAGATANEGFLEDYARHIDNLEIPPPPPPVQSFDGTGPRLLITKVVNENFKSYYGRHELGPFHKNFTSIVGPNGSGKSNVIDSLLFVFGYRAQRIRSKNVSVLIHNSELHPNVNYCTVEVHFVKVIDRDHGEFDIVNHSGFTISRTAFKNNSSEYFIDRRKVQFKDVGAKLRLHGIDIDHNRFLILQGEVEQISLMKPKAQAEGEEGMLEYLEDIIGSSRLRPFLDELQKHTDELNEMRNDKAQRAKTVEEEKVELEGPKNEAVAFLEMENDITRKKNILFQRYIMETAENCEKVIREGEAVKAKYEEKEQEMEEVRGEIKGKKSQYHDLKKKADELQKEVERQTTTFKTLEKEDTKLREDLKHCKGKTKALEANQEAEKKKLKNFQAQPDKFEKELQELQHKIKDLEAKRVDADKRLQDGLSRLQGETKAKQAEKKVLEEKLIARQQGVNEAREKLKIAQSELELCLSAQKREQTKLDDSKTSLAKVTQRLEECQSKISDAEKSIPEVEKQLQKLERRVKEVTAEERDLSEKIREKTTKVGVASANLQSSGNRNRVLDALFNQQKRGKLSGIFGRLGDLGAIDEKYDVAISTACGPLDNVVVDTIDTAQKCVTFLTENNVGMATFIGLDKMKRFEQTMKQRMQAPENVPRLFDLVVVEDQRVLPAFYYALRDTLVAKDLEQATRVAYQGGKAKHRVVTLAGEIIDISGTMSGGGNRQSRGRMGRSVVATPNSDDMTAEQLQAVEAEIAKERRQAEELRVLKLRLETEREKLGPELQKMKLDLNSWRMDVRASTDQKQTLETQVKAQEKTLRQTVPDEQEKNRLTKLVDQYQKEYDKVAEKSVAIQDDVKKVDEAIQEIKEKCVGCIEKEMDAYRRQIEDAEKSIGKTKVASKTALRNIKNTEEKVEALTQDIESNMAAIETITKRLKELEDEGEAAVLAREAAVKEMKSFETELHDAKARVSGLEEKEQQIQEALIDCKTRVDHVEATLKTFQQKKKYWENERNKLELHDIRRMCGLPPASPVPRPRPVSRNDRDDVAENVDEHEVKPLVNGEQQAAADGQQESMDVEDTEEGEEAIELKMYSVDYLKRVDQQALTVTLTAMEERLQDLRPNLDALNEYRKKEEKYQKIMSQLDEVTKMRDRFRDTYEEIRKKRLNEFMDGFTIISSKLKEMYQMITLGGDADLELVDTMDPFTEGISFSVRPPKKSWKQISNLSGGEKTLSSLSLVFALHHYKPTPLYVMDEIDAALDFKNVSIVAHYIKERTKNAQFIIISLRNNMFELADRLVGIYKTHHCTKTAVIDPGKICLKPPRFHPAAVPPAPLTPPIAATATSVTPKRAVFRDRSSEMNAATMPDEEFAAKPEPTSTDKMRMTPSL